MPGEEADHTSRTLGTAWQNSATRGSIGDFYFTEGVDQQSVSWLNYNLIKLLYYKILKNKI